MEVITLRTLQAMSEEQLKAFLESVQADAGLQEKLKAAGDADAVVAIAKAAGFMLSAGELQRAQAEISEDELEGVDGGMPPIPKDALKTKVLVLGGCGAL
jgi:predicted ribosomally synthesized peptide with nif11-like leader